MQSELKDRWPAPVGLLCALPGTLTLGSLFLCCPRCGSGGPRHAMGFSVHSSRGCRQQILLVSMWPLHQGSECTGQGAWPPPPRYQGMGPPGRDLHLQLQPCRAKGSQQRDSAGLFCQALRVIRPSPQVRTADHRLKDYP